MNYAGPSWGRIVAAGALLAVGAAATLYVARALRERSREAPARRGPSAGRPLTLLRGGAGEG
jgi:hypothetical protein